MSYVDKEKQKETEQRYWKAHREERSARERERYKKNGIQKRAAMAERYALKKLGITLPVSAKKQPLEVSQEKAPMRYCAVHKRAWVPDLQWEPFNIDLFWYAKAIAKGGNCDNQLSLQEEKCDLCLLQ